MTKHDPSGAKIGANPDKNTAGPRKSRTIRFSDSEWDWVETSARQRGMAAAEFVRDAALSQIEDDSIEDAAQIPPGIVALIETTYRNTYFLATLKRDELIRERRDDEVNELVQAARESQALLLNQASE